jgi:hypothetical protein
MLFSIIGFVKTQNNFQFVTLINVLGSNSNKMSANDDVGQRFICYLVLPSAARLDRALFDRQFRELFPILSATDENLDGPNNPSHSNTLALFSLNGVVLTASFVDAPLPFSEWDFAVKQNLVWPEARQSLKQHKAHVVVTALAEAHNPRDIKRTAQIVTATSITLASVTRAQAAVWAEGQCLTKGDSFVASASSVDRGDPAITIWIGMLFGSGPKTAKGEITCGAMTSGLLPFMGREVELELSPLPLLIVAQRLLGVLHYLFANGPILKDGDSLGINATERIRVRHSDETVRRGVPVLKLTVENLA